MNWIQTLIADRSNLLPGASIEEIAEIERKFNISLPAAFKEFLQAVDGGMLTKNIIVYSAGKGIHPFETLWSSNENRDVEFPIFFIAREAEEEFAFKREDMSLPDPPVYIYLHEYGEIKQVSKTFKDFIAAIFSGKGIKLL